MGIAMRDSEQMAPPVPAASDFFGDSSPAVTGAACVILVLAIAVIDQLTGFDLHLRIVYLVPVAIVTWSAGRTVGIGLSVLAAAVWIGMVRSAHDYGDGLSFYWDAARLLITFLVVVLLVAKLREALRARELSFTALEKLDAPAYVLDLQRTVVLLGNRQFRATYAGRPVEELAACPAREARFSMADGRPALLRILLTP
jgi:hypothetical protein